MYTVYYCVQILTVYVLYTSVQCRVYTVHCKQFVAAVKQTRLMSLSVEHISAYFRAVGDEDEEEEEPEGDENTGRSEKKEVKKSKKKAKGALRAAPAPPSSPSSWPPALPFSSCASLPHPHLPHILLPPPPLPPSLPPSLPPFLTLRRSKGLFPPPGVPMRWPGPTLARRARSS